MQVMSYYARPREYSAGGVNKSRRDWMVALSGIEGVSVVMLDAVGGYASTLPEGAPLEVRAVKHWGTRRRSMVPRGLRRQLKGVDLLYLHEGWTLSNLVASVTARLKGIPYVVMPHGVYESEIVATLRRVPFRRRLERMLLERAKFVHLFLPGELRDLAELAPRSRGVPIVTGFPSVDSTWEGKGSEYLSWAARYDVYHKGIDILLSAMARIDPELRPRLRMVGPDYKGGRAQTMRMVQCLGLQEHVDVGEALDSTQLGEFIRRSKAFVHTPRWECFGRTIADSMIMGVPVLLSASAKMSEVTDPEGALVVDLSEEGVATGLQLVWAEADPSLGRRGREWAEGYFCWPRSLEKWVAEV